MFITKTKKVVAGLSIIAATGLLFSCGSKIDKSTPEAYFKSVMVNKVETVTGDFETGLSNYFEFEKSENFNADTEMTVEIGKNGKDLINLASSVYGVDAATVDISWLKDISLGMKYQQSKKLFSFDVNAKLNKTHIASALIFADFEKSGLYLKLPEFCENFFLIKDEAELNSIEETLSRRDEIFKSLPSLKLLKSLIDESTAALFSGISGVEKTSDIVAIAGDEKVIENTHDILKLTITEEVAKSMSESLAKYLETSKSFEEFVVWGSEQFGVYKTKEEVAKEFVNDFSEVLNELKNAVITIYPNKDGELAGFAMKVDDSSFKWNTVQSGSDYGMDISVLESGREMFNLSGIGAYANKSVSGKFTGKVFNQRTRKLADAFELTTKDVSFSKIKNDGTSESVAISFKNDFLRNGLELDRQMSGILSNFTYIIEGKGTKSSGEAKISIANSEFEPYVSFLINSNVKSNASIKLPAEKDCISSEDNSAVENAVTAADFKTVSENLKKAGVPEELTAILSYMTPAQMLGYGYGYGY